MTDMFDFHLQRDRLYEQVADQILELISCESLRPGDKLPGERELAEKLEVSRTVIREAIRSLHVRGVVKVKPGCGTYVQALSGTDAAASLHLMLKLRQSRDTIDDLYEIRKMIEVEIAGLAAERATPEDLAALDATVEGMVASMDDPAEFTQHDMSFHATLAAATHNELFSVLLSPISNLRLDAIRTSLQAPRAAEDGLHHHRSILARVKEGDPTGARQAMCDHIDHSQSQVRSVQG
ncbi:MAG: FadR family transcriptional regulator [Chloroflexi bacterium]|nr:FadR family transcriptional regulator [Chloroflexota bacterium]